MKPQYAGLVGDVGGTNARFALVDAQGHVRHPRIFAAGAVVRGHDPASDGTGMGVAVFTGWLAGRSAAGRDS